MQWGDWLLSLLRWLCSVFCSRGGGNHQCRLPWAAGAGISGHGGDEVATAGQFPHDTVSHGGGSRVAEVAACLGRRCDAECVKREPSKHLFSPFFFHLPAFITAIAQVVVLCFSLKIRNTSLLFTPRLFVNTEKFFKNLSEDKNCTFKCHLGVSQMSCHFMLGLLGAL